MYYSILINDAQKRMLTVNTITEVEAVIKDCFKKRIEARAWTPDGSTVARSWADYQTNKFKYNIKAHE